MKRPISFTWLIAVSVLTFSHAARAAHVESQHQEQSSRAEYDAMVAEHAKANGVPEALVHRVILRESRYQPKLVSHGCIGLMQIKLGTARSLGYSGDAEGLRDANTNLTYGVKYLAGAYRAANGDHNRAVGYYTTGYYEVTKRQRIDRVRHAEPALAIAPAKEVLAKEISASETPNNPADANALQQVPAK